MSREGANQERPSPTSLSSRQGESACTPQNGQMQLNMGNTTAPRRRRESATPPDTWLHAKGPTLWIWRCLRPTWERDCERDSTAARIAWLTPLVTHQIHRLTATGCCIGWPQLRANASLAIALGLWRGVLQWPWRARPSRPRRVTPSSHGRLIFTVPYRRDKRAARVLGKLRSATGAFPLTANPICPHDPSRDATPRARRFSPWRCTAA
ncbi:hypothetical protein BS50DRAFT_42343 [Corynespora cassiicola Philippines]|uniref:Uncharacterized protein n=1 Tax=Corynespora cassiicola Philippines TaxID=1448308 RepID=A0A2T2PCZ8_CORCC|nr:hypothetical protein BS50DRAFT_42343 [Corynespora cassiicola Philippines]